MRMTCYGGRSASCAASAGCSQEVEMEERRPGTGVHVLDGPLVNGSSLPVSQVQVRPLGPRESVEALTPCDASELPREPVASDHIRAEASGRSPAGLEEPEAEAGELPDGSSDSLSETDWETTRYLAVETQLNLRYASSVVRQIIGEPFGAVAPAAGADVVVVTRWALAALRRRAWRDAVLTGLLITGLAAFVG